MSETDAVLRIRRVGSIDEARSLMAEELAQAWDEGWQAGCNDQQCGDDNAEPWTPNPYTTESAFTGRSTRPTPPDSTRP